MGRDFGVANVWLDGELTKVALELDDLLLEFVFPANEGGKQNVAGLEHELHGKLGRARGNRPDSEPRCVCSSG